MKPRNLAATRPVPDLTKRVRLTRLARELAKIDPKEEKELAEEGLTDENQLEA